MRTPEVVATPEPVPARGEATTLEEEEIPLRAAGKASVEEAGDGCMPSPYETEV